MALSIDQWVSGLRAHGAQEVDQYEQKLRSFGANEQKIFELLSEARAAMHIPRNGWAVTMRDSVIVRPKIVAIAHFERI